MLPNIGVKLCINTTLNPKNYKGNPNYENLIFKCSIYTVYTQIVQNTSQYFIVLYVNLNINLILVYSVRYSPIKYIN